MNLKLFLVTINPLDVVLWTLRRNQRDVINLYNTLSPIMQVATGGSMLNFGYWDEYHVTPISAQENLCSYFADMSELNSANLILDVGSGLSAPAIFWQKNYPDLSINCININYSQLQCSKVGKKIQFLNSSSTSLPFCDDSVDRVLALESAQHFKPFSDFISESKRVLSSSGILALAIPVVIDSTSISKLGILKFTWSSEHYMLENIRSMINDNGFKILEQDLIGSSVYEPLARYYIAHRDKLRKLITKKYSSYVESILFKSIQKMAQASEEQIIEYVLLKCKMK